MQETLVAAIAALKAQGIRIAVDPSDMGADVYIATVPSGEKYELLASGLIKLEAAGKLNAAGLAETGHKIVSA
jgi:hypothetical protein